MSTLAKNAVFDRKFLAELDRLRTCIESLPASHRAELLSAANTAQERHETMQAASRSIENMVADIGLMVERAKFEVEACKRESCAVEPAARCPL